MVLNKMELRDAIKQKAGELGFNLAGITNADPIEEDHADIFGMWLSSGRAGQMKYLQKDLDRRLIPSKLLEGARSVICTALCYKRPASQEPAPPAGRAVGRIAAYAQYEDYHAFIQNLLYRLVEFIKTQANHPNLKFKICVDSAPVAERALAQRAGLGFIGKNHMLINPGLGCRILLGEIITDLQITPDKPIRTRCSTCDKCIKACPTAALGYDGSFDATRCISYLTGEYEGPIPRQMMSKIGGCLFGCDQCILACPYENKDISPPNPAFKFFPDRVYMDLNTVKLWDRTQFEHYFANSPLARLGFERFKRNTLVCLENIRAGQDQGTRNTSFWSEGISRP